MYLSKVQLHWRGVRNPYDWHRALWRLFPDQANAKREFLFRIEQQSLGQNALVLLQSPIIPISSDADAPVVLQTKQLDLSKLSEGMTLRFRLTANVIKTIRDAKNPERSVRVPLIKDEQQLEWLHRKLEGAAMLEAAVATSNESIFFKRKGQPGKLATVTFDGLLRVQDATAFQQLAVKGIGAAKSFGCGLLSLARG